MRYPFIGQSGPTDCGPACLAMILAFHRRPAPLAELCSLAGTGIRGTSLAGLAHAARQAGFEAHGVRSADTTLPCGETPLIAHLREEAFAHFVVVFECRPGQVLVADPARGMGWSRAEL